MRSVIFGCLLAVQTTQGYAADSPTRAGYGETAVAFAPNGEWVVTGGADSKLRIRSAQDGELRTTLTGHTGPVVAVAVSPDGQTIASLSQDETVRLWDVDRWTEKRLLHPAQHFRHPGAIAFAPDGRTIAIGSRDMRHGKEYRELLRLPATRDTLGAPESEHDTWCGSLRLWDVASGELQAWWQAAPNFVNSVIFAPDGRTIATVGDDNIVKLWDAKTHKLQREFPQNLDCAASFAFAPDGKLLAIATRGSLVLYDPGTGTVRTKLEVPDSVFAASLLVFTPDDGLIITDDGIFGYIFSTGFVVDQAPPFKLREATRNVCTGLAIAPDGKSVAYSFCYRKDTGHQTFEVKKLPILYR